MVQDTVPVQAGRSLRAPQPEVWNSTAKHFSISKAKMQSAHVQQTGRNGFLLTPQHKPPQQLGAPIHGIPPQSLSGRMAEQCTQPPPPSRSHAAMLAKMQVDMSDDGADDEADAWPEDTHCPMWRLHLPHCCLMHAIDMAYTPWLFWCVRMPAPGISGSMALNGLR